MAIVFMDSFDGYATADVVKKWTSLNTACTIGTTNARRANSLTLTNQNELVKGFTAADTYIMGFYHFTSTLTGIADGGVGSVILEIREGATKHLSFFLNPSGQIGVQRGGAGGTVLARSAGGSIQSGVGFYMEVKVKVNDTTGTVEVRLNGSTTPIINLTNQDTRNAGTVGTIDSIALVGVLNTSYFDDFVLLDTSGAAPNNDFIGDRTIVGLLPTGNGTYGDFTASAGLRYQCVDDTTPNTTDYNSSGTSGHKDTFTFPALPTTVGTINAVAVNLAALKDDAGAMNHQSYVKSGATESAGSSIALSTAQRIDQFIYPLDPNAGPGAWTRANVNSAEFGYKIP